MPTRQTVIYDRAMTQIPVICGAKQNTGKFLASADLLVTLIDSRLYPGKARPENHSLLQKCKDCWGINIGNDSCSREILTARVP